MKAFKVFIFGLLFGWLVKFAIDRIYRDNEIEDIRNENASLREYIRLLESKPGSPESKPLKRAAAQSVQTEGGKDDLKVIKGIGPVLEKKLNDAGILTFAALAGLTAEELENIFGDTSRLVQEGNLIVQAKKLAGQKEA